MQEMRHERQEFEKDPLEEETTTHSIFFPWGSLAIYSPLGPKELDLTEHIFYIYDDFFFYSF